MEAVIEASCCGRSRRLGRNMAEMGGNPVMTRVMSDRTFSCYSAFITEQLGIRMPIAKKTMLQSRLAKRLRAMGISSFEEYFDYIRSVEGRVREFHNFINAVTTNKTDFFREPKHFENLVRMVLPELLGRKEPNNKHIRLWSVACSTGEEPYTLAMVLENYLAGQTDEVSYAILATDISTRVLEAAHLGIYDESRLETTPPDFKKRFFLRSRDRNSSKVRVIPKLRARVTCRWLNLMHDYGIKQKMDIIFCRNVIIYFSRHTQDAILQNISGCLEAGGYLFMGHSETLSNPGRFRLVQAAPTIYRKQA